MLKHIGSHSTNGSLGNTSKYGITKFRKDGGAYSSSSICGTFQHEVGGVLPAVNIHASIIVPATVVTMPPVAAKSMFMESIMLLK